MRAIPPFRLIPEPLTEEATELPGFKWAGPETGKRHRLGGEPSFLQQAAHPTCSSCGQEMTFYGQLDSINDEIVLADAGLVFVFVCFHCFCVCFDCFTSTAFIQSG
ncbi:MAG: hypothetical protein QOJ19_1739 [Acidimicrobiia bacterium]|nr:hypothetical protein [Acidimicrobiia bacterium]